MGMNDEIKRKYIQFKLIEEQIKELSEKMDLVEKQQQELQNTKSALEQLPDIGVDSEVLMPFAAGIFLRGKLASNTSVFVRAGSGVTSEKDPKEALAMVDGQLEQLSEYEKDITEGLTQLSGMADRVNQELTQLQEQ